MDTNDPLERYRQKRNFDLTPEPAEGGQSNACSLSFVIQKHWASRLHYDFRLEFEGTLRSWAVPKGPSLDPHVKRMAVQVEDHPLSYGSFEGTIPAKQYGAGEVIVWDRGTWTPIEDAAMGFRSGKLKFELKGEKLRGKWTLVRMRGNDEKQPPWLLIKEHDGEERPANEYDITEAQPDSIISSPAMKAVASKKSSARNAAGQTGKAPARTTARSRPSAAAKPKAPQHAGMPPGAVASDVPDTLSPQLATLVESPPQHGDWLYELKFDGYRLVTRLDGKSVVCFTRNGHDWTEKMPQLAGALKDLGLERTWLDGEIIVPNAEGIPDFQLLQNAFEARGRRAAAGAPLATPQAAQIVFYVFDIPFYRGHDLRDVPFKERRALLEQVMAKNTSPNIRFSQSFDAPLGELVVSACKLGFEGLIGKLADSTYRSQRSSAWIKLKCGRRQEFVICGFTDPKGSRTGIGALLLGIHDANGELQYAGNVGSGFSDKTLTELKKRLDKLETEIRPFSRQTSIVGRPHWVKPELLAEVSFAEWTHSNHVRHAVFRGLRADKPPQSITREKAVKPTEIDEAAQGTPRSGRVKKTAQQSKAGSAKASAPSSAKAETKPVESDEKKPAAKGEAETSMRRKGPAASDAITLPKSLRITHPDRVIDKQSGVTKLQLVQHYALVAPLMLQHLKGRPVSLLRVPSGVDGEVFFQKHAKEGELPGVNLLDPALDRDHTPLLEISSAQGLLSAAQMNTVEFHTWNAVASAIDKPDRMTFDLDPGEGVEWSSMQQAATLVRTMLEELELVPFLKTSGGKGLHVVVPLKKQLGWDAVKDFSHHIVNHLAKTLPQLFVAKSGPANRVGKIFVDYLRNGFGATTACAWTARARPGLGVSVPVAWDELASLDSGAHWTLQTVTERVEIGNSPWDSYAKSARALGPSMRMLDYKR